MDLAAINRANEGRADGLLGVRITAIGDDFIRGELSVETRTHQPFGLLHGGVSCVMAETLGSIGSNLACDEDHYAVGIELNASHMNGVREGTVIGTARPLRIGRRLQTWSISIESEDGRAVCAARLTTAVLPLVQATPG